MNEKESKPVFYYTTQEKVLSEEIVEKSKAKGLSFQ